MTRFPRRLALAGAGLLAAPRLQAQAPWPDRPIRWIVNFPPGGAADTLSRILVERIGNRLGQPVVVENRPGAGGMVGADLVAKARGDAAIVIMSNAASHGIGPVLERIPEGARVIASSRYCPNQAFAMGRHLGMQCHVEMTPALIRSWCEDWHKEVTSLAQRTPSVQAPEAILQDLEPRTARLNDVARVLYERWTEGLAG